MTRNNLLIPVFLCLVLICAYLAFPSSQQASKDDITVLVLLGEWFGDTYFPLKDKIESYGWNQMRVGVEASYRGCYNKSRDIELHSDILISDLKDFSKYDCLIIPSGPQFRKFKENKEVLKFVREAHEKGLLIASFCTGNNVVNAAGVTEFKKISEIFPSQVTLVKERVLFGPRGGGPPPGDGYKSAPIDDICSAIARELGVSVPLAKNLDHEQLKPSSAL